MAFEAQGEIVTTVQLVHKTKAVLRLEPGQEVDVLYDARRPTNAIVVSLYS